MPTVWPASPACCLCCKGHAGAELSRARCAAQAARQAVEREAAEMDAICRAALEAAEREVSCKLLLVQCLPE